MARLLTQRRLLTMVIGLLLITSQLGADASNWTVKIPHYVFAGVLTPFTNLVRWATGGYHAPADDGLDLGVYEQLADNYEAALRRQAYLEQQLIIAQEQVTELAGVRQHTDSAGVALVYATVTTWSHANGVLSLTLNRGRRSGIAVGQAVSSGMNLVGRVVGVTPMTARVELVTSPRMTLLARLVPPTPGPASRQMVAEFKPTGDDRLEAVVGIDEPVVVGDLAHLFDETWPSEASGCVVGQVVAIRDMDNNPYLLKRVIVQPVQTLSRLHRVVVLTPLSQSIPTPQVPMNFSE